MLKSTTDALVAPWVTLRGPAGPALSLAFRVHLKQCLRDLLGGRANGRKGDALDPIFGAWRTLCFAAWFVRREAPLLTCGPKSTLEEQPVGVDFGGTRHQIWHLVYQSSRYKKSRAVPGSSGLA